MRVLVVDDSRDNRLFVAACLRAEGMVIEQAADGLAALQLALAHCPDLVILDVDLPVLDGLETLRGIRSAGLGPTDVRVIALTARSEIDTSVRCTEAGADDYLAKPVRDPSVLRAKVRAQVAELARSRSAVPPLGTPIHIRPRNTRPI
jgi:DNA-binding response OmpR family regulator